MDDQSGHEKRLLVFEALEDGAVWLEQRAFNGDQRVFDLESARVRLLAELEGRDRPDLPAIIDAYATSRMVRSAQDALQLGGSLIDMLEDLLDRPEAYGVEIVSKLDEETLLVEERDA